MSEVHTLAAASRNRSGKGGARATRRDGRVPGFVYGDKRDPDMISLDPRDLQKELGQAGFYATLFDISVDGKKQRVLPRDVQYDPVTDFPIHVDFLRVSAATSVTVAVPVNFLNEEDCPGLSQGGLLNVVRHEIELSCRADAIPQQIDVDLSGLNIGDGVHISMVSLPDGVEPTITDRDFTIATIAAPTVVAEEAAEAQAEAEGEAEEAAPEAEGEAAAEEEKSED